MSRRLTALVYGEPGTGKSWLFNSAPGPRLLFDAEGRADYLPDLEADPSGRTPQKVVYWNPRDPVPAESEDPSIVTVIDVQSFDDIALGYRWLESGKHPFKSIGLDSITEIQQRLIDKVAGDGPVQLQHWNSVLRELEKQVRAFRDLRKHPTNPPWAFVTLAGKRDKDDNLGPMLQGQLADKIAHHFDVVGFMEKRTNATTGEKERTLLIDGYREGVQAKDNTHVLSLNYGDTIINPNITSMLSVLNPDRGGSAETSD